MELSTNHLTQTIKAVSSDFIGSISSTMLSFILGLYILNHYSSGIIFSVSQILGPFIGFLLWPLIGTIIDRFNHKKIILLSQLISIFGIIIFAQQIGKQNNLVSLFSLIILIQTSLYFINISYASSVSSMVEKRYIGRLNSLENIAKSLSNILGPILGGVLFSKVSITYFLWIECFSEIISLLITMSINFNIFSNKSINSSRPDTSIFSGFRYLKSNRTIRLLIFENTLSNVFTPVISIGIPIVAIQLLNINSSSFGSIEGISGLGLILGGILSFLSKKKISIRHIQFPLLFQSLTFLIPTTLFFSNSHWINFLILSMTYSLFAASINYFNIQFNTYQQTHVKTHLQGRVFTISLVLSQLFSPIGKIIFGILFTHPTMSKTVAIYISTFSLQLLVVSIFTIFLLKFHTTLAPKEYK
ncbi:MFS transporter [Pediococcus claussenii]|uniref:Major Facilitator Superfamily protein n=1 Tax=Pediococcus claussenii (strain ATCC BAA-344 / DSM 14800 / JCM 18046 / KCTC 3811 / LMG 21948 / P06) TaxID=701521 RepID=G8PAX7_PEDCP|nr:MFS transporter [Pediococcus claussenii]AEV95845.1 major Facilitator Superfamily protein [Pediococcus claussenii ATCC BAA-344]ANZ69343.1 hypothetical protein AYR57_03050 [Pediococcus claussenii]ANZ71163.1 hypothetical protein AYR58_03065 [Pediococcus claussenii]KRN20452.1 hypothetical protein IV79_GL000507 [Pediococcus claussenii]